MDRTHLEKQRAEVFADKEDRNLLLHVGYFTTWYNQCEFRLTLLMAIVMNERDLAAFHQLTLGMDGKTKARRFKRLCAIKKWPVSQEFEDQLDRFRKIGELRDKIAHRALFNEEKTLDRFYYANLDRLPWRALGVAHAKNEPSPDHILSIDLFECALWLNHFAEDLNEVMELALNQLPLGAKNPHAKVPQPSLENSPVQGSQPNPDTLGRIPPETQG